MEPEGEEDMPKLPGVAKPMKICKSLKQVELS
jgi:hypothetical protein